VSGSKKTALLTDDQYAAGIERIRSVLRLSTPDEQPVFKVDIAMMMQCGGWPPKLIVSRRPRLCG
jgi:hypothetical protein